MKKSQTIFLAGTVLLATVSCQVDSSSDLRDALTFYSSFDNGTSADFALGDKSIYSAPSRRSLDSLQAGISITDHEILKARGKVGDAFKFGSRSDKVVFYKSKDNISYDVQNWSGTISFWLSLDPATDLEPGYTDPIQITDVRYNDASIWVDFTNKNPRDFRLGVIGDLNVWSLDTLESSSDAEFERRLVRVKNPPFTKNGWTHVLITYQALGTSQSSSTLFLNGEKIGSVEGIDDPFTWDLEKSNIYIGLGFIGLMDELAIFNKPLTDEQVLEVYQLEGGIKSIL
ncbi:MAG: LamG-like jellyroll fold domain-containing protein [Cyclobacteriaceae bacterium]